LTDAGSGERATSTRRTIVAGLAILLIPVLGSLLLTRDLPDLQIGMRERVLLPILIVVRLTLSWRRRQALVPWIDLPLLGLVFVFTGGASSPLDPALFFIYVLLAFHVERAPGGLQRSVSFLGGITVMYGLLLWHVREDAVRAVNELELELDEEIVQRRQERTGATFDRLAAEQSYSTLRELIDLDRAATPAVQDVPFFGPETDGAESTLDGVAVRLLDALDRRESVLAETGHLLRANLDTFSVDALTDRLDEALSETDAIKDGVNEELLDAVGLVMSSDAAPPDREDYFEWMKTAFFDEIDLVFSQQEEFRTALGEQVSSVLDLAAYREALRREIDRLTTERIALSILILATLSLVAALRRAYEREVEQREQERAARELSVKEREKENWIALTAGLTHTIGNDILAYDAYGEEALDAIDDHDAPLPPEIEQNLRFIVDSNKARMGFIKFLDEFARARKEQDSGRAVRPVGLRPVNLPSMLKAVRRQVGEVEVADLPRESRDPAVVRQREKFLHLPLEVVCLAPHSADGGVGAEEVDDEEAGTLTNGKPGILQFFFYELIKNALRNCSGDEPLRAEVVKGDGRVTVRIVNDVGVREIESGDGATRFVLPRLADMEPVDEGGLHRKVEEALSNCFEPGRGGGTGLGLFLIRYFAREYYAGQISARVFDWPRRRVAFELELPDDLEDLEHLEDLKGTES